MAAASGFGLRLVAYWPDGGRVGPMPDVLEMTLTSPLNEEPTLTVSYPVAGGVRGDLLDGEIELAVEYTPDNGASWVEPPGARFITTKVERNLLADGTESRRAHQPPSSGGPGVGSSKDGAGRGWEVELPVRELRDDRQDSVGRRSGTGLGEGPDPAGFFVR